MQGLLQNWVVGRKRLDGRRRLLRGRDPYLVLATRDGENDARLAGSTALRRLDVTLLHGLVLEGPESILGLDEYFLKKPVF